MAAMVYVARNLYLPDGTRLVARVLTVAGGKVAGVSAFEAETPSMIFVESVFLSDSPLLKVVADIKNDARPLVEHYYAYAADECGRLKLLS